MAPVQAPSSFLPYICSATVDCSNLLFCNSALDSGRCLYFKITVLSSTFSSMEKSRPLTLVSSAHRHPEPHTNKQHDVVLDYVINSGFAGTAKVLSSSRVPSAPCSSTSTPSSERVEGEEGMDVDDGGIDSGALGTPATPATPASAGGAVGESPIRSALAAAAARRLAATSPGTPTPASDAIKDDAPANGNSSNGKGAIKGDGVPAIDQATLESIDHRRGEYTEWSRECSSRPCFAIAPLHCIR